FFFSSRRRHTRSKRDWSSVVCSSDLPEAGDIAPEAEEEGRAGHGPWDYDNRPLDDDDPRLINLGSLILVGHPDVGVQLAGTGEEIGRASCRRREEGGGRGGGGEDDKE